jgi:hypothetical protein
MGDTWAGIVFRVTLVAALALVHRPFGDYMARVLTGTRHWRHGPPARGRPGTLCGGDDGRTGGRS